MSAREFLNGIIKSYSQIFFAENVKFSWILLLVSFFDPTTGLAGLSSVLLTNVIAYRLGFNRTEIAKGLYGFNSLLVGLGMGYYFEASPELYLVILVASVLTLLFVTLFKGILMKYGLPYLSLPFLFSLWTILIASGSFENLGISQKGIFTLNYLYGIGGEALVGLYEYLNSIGFEGSLRTYFLSLGAIFFQFKAISGILIAAGLLIFSRIAFVLSLYGFYIAYLFYTILGGNIEELSYTYIGFNFILTAIAIGGFYLIPSKKTFFWLLILIPLVTLLSISLARVLEIFNLAVYSLPFNILVLLFLYTLKFRVFPSIKLQEAIVQQYHPEKNLYSYHNHQGKAVHHYLHNMKLPFHGEWTVSQGHDGEYTHREDWRFAWDFVITDENGKQFRDEGLYPTDYYCYGKSVLAPGDGQVEEVTGNIPDNAIGNVNLIHNWGNTVIIKHSETLYSSMNHLREDSVCVEPGQKVKKGQKIGEVGNSGRSPYPHLHFQFQTTPWPGSKTLKYPFSYYMLKTKDRHELREFTFPRKDDRLHNADVTGFITNRLHFIPGQILEVSITINGREQKKEWEVITSPWNETYIQDPENRARLYFLNNGSFIYLTHFEGSRTSPLYGFYLGLNKLFLGWYPNGTLTDQLPPNKTWKSLPLFIQDMVSPFYMFLQSEYKLTYRDIDNPMDPGEVQLSASLENKAFNRVVNRRDFQIVINKSSLIFTMKDRGLTPSSKPANANKEDEIMVKIQ